MAYQTKELNEALDNLRNLAIKNMSTSSEFGIDFFGDLDKIYDVDIFLSRKPGMKSSCQLMAFGNNTDEASKRISIMTILSSFLNTLLDTKTFTIEELKEVLNSVLTVYGELNGTDDEIRIKNITEKFDSIKLYDTSFPTNCIHTISLYCINHDGFIGTNYGNVTLGDLMRITYEDYNYMRNVGDKKISYADKYRRELANLYNLTQRLDGSYIDKIES